jgi:glycosyltransferase involved in cell wall biosynthesis
MAHELFRTGQWQVTLAASDFNLQSRKFTRRNSATDRRPVPEMTMGVNFCWLWSSPYVGNDWRRIRNWVSFAWSLLRADRQLGHFDVVVGSSPHLIAAFAAYIVARRRRVPFVFEVRDLWPESLQVGSARRGIAYRVLQQIANTLYRVADRLVVLTEGVGTYLVQAGVPSVKIVFAPNGVSISHFSETSPQQDGAAIRLIYAGAHGPANGLDIVIDAAVRLAHRKDIQFVLLGDGIERERLRSRADALQLPNICFADPVAKEQMPRVLAGCSAGLMILKDVPLFAFGVSPNKLFDYWAASLPVINTVPGEVADLVVASGGGIQVEAATGEALSRAVLEFAEWPVERRRTIGTAGRAWVRAHRDRPLIAGRFAEALAEVVSVGNKV